MAQDAERSSSRDEWDAVSLLVRSKHRAALLRALIAGPLTPSQVAARTGIDIAQVSRNLTTMREAGLVELLVPETSRKGRLYRATERGERALALLDETGLG